MGKKIVSTGNGNIKKVVVYKQNECNGVGLLNKVRRYVFQLGDLESNVILLQLS